MKQQSGLGKRAEKRRARKAEFMTEAAKVFVELGLRDATMDDVAAQIGVSKVVLYRYFGSKEDLVDSILDGMLQQLLEVDRMPWAGYQTAIRRSTVVARKDTAAFLLLARDARNDPVFCHHHEKVWRGVAERLIAAFLEFGLDEHHAKISGEAMMAFVLNAQVYWIENGSEDRDEAFEEWAAVGAHALDRQWRKQYAQQPDSVKAAS